MMNKQLKSDSFALAMIWQASTQNQIFQALMQAMSRPGKLVSLEKLLDGGNVATAVLATLSDAQVKVSNCDALISEVEWSLSQCQNGTPDVADYIFCDGSLPCSISPKLGSLPSPDQSATVILTVKDLLGGNTHMQLSGPGVDETLDIAISGLHPSWLQQRQDWNSQFPMGVDLLLTNKTSVLALPRTTQLEVLA